MKILLVSNRFKNIDQPNLEHEFKQFLDNTLQGTAETVHTYYDKLLFTIKDGKFTAYDTYNDQEISGYDAVFYRGPWLYQDRECAYYISRYCKLNNLLCINDYSAYYPGTKFAQGIVFMECDAPILETVYSIRKDELIDHAETTFGYPYILKTNLGSHGDSNYLVNTREEAVTIITEEPDVDFLAQAYCPNDRDYRLLIIGSKEIIIERRGSSDTHLNNTSKGAVAKLANEALSSEVISKARKIMLALGLTIAGVDVIVNTDTKRSYFLEINSQPQIRTGALVEDKAELLRSFFANL